MKSTAWSIGSLAARFGLATHVLRHWETVGLLTPDRTSADRRRYDDNDVFRVAVILRAKEGGLSLETIRRLLDATDVRARRELLRRQRDELNDALARIRRSVELLEHALDCDHEDFTNCPTFRSRLTRG